jgi:hypothetical protein
MGSGEAAAHQCSSSITERPMDRSPKTHHMLKIRLERARAQGHPDGEPGEGYELVAPLDAAGHINVEGWRSQRALCFVHRLEGGDIVERGLLLHRAGGPGGATWMFDYDPRSIGEEEMGHHFEAHAFTPGEYVSIRDGDGALLTYRVTKVSPA